MGQPASLARCFRFHRGHGQEQTNRCLGFKMTGTFTTRNHYNPCFWTALWNKEYYAQYCTNERSRKPARDQVVYALNLNANKILKTKVEQVHFHKDLGVAAITPESAKRFCARWYPEKYDTFCEDIASHPETVYLDFEDILSGMETQASYSSLMQAAKLGSLTSVEHKGFLTCLLIMHAMRSYEFMSMLVDMTNSEDVDKWEYFWLLKKTWSSQSFLARAVTVPAFSEWTLWRTSDHTFPLCDSPVMMDRDSLMAVLSPRLLLEINLNIRRPEQYWRVCDEVPGHVLAAFRRRSIANSFREIIFHDQAILEEWKSSDHARARIMALRDPSNLKTCIEEGASRIIFGLKGFDRLDNAGQFSTSLH